MSASRLKAFLLCIPEGWAGGREGDGMHTGVLKLQACRARTTAAIAAVSR